MSQKSCFGRCHLDALRRLEKLHECLITIDFKHFTASYFAVFLSDFDEFVVFYALDALNEHKRPDDFSYRIVFFKHQIPPSSVSACISFLISASMSSNLDISLSGIYFALPICSLT